MAKGLRKVWDCKVELLEKIAKMHEKLNHNLHLGIEFIFYSEWCHGDELKREKIVEFPLLDLKF